MSNDLVRWLIAVVVLAHGVGHVLFMPILNGAMRLEASGDSWLLTPAVGATTVRAVASVMAAVALVGFVAGAAGFGLQSAWWRPVTIGAAVVSAVLVVAMWGGVPTSSAFFALAFDAVVLAALLVFDWPTTQVIAR